MSPAEYILNPQWETLACAVAIDREAPFLLPQDEIAPFLRNIKQPYAFITHNALFDACVTAFHYKIHPPVLFCTLSMARALIYHEIPNGRISLKSVLKHLGLPEKGVFIHQMRGVHWRDLVADPGKLMLFSAYAINDVEGCREIFFRLQPDFPPSEVMIMDRTIRMATQPKLMVDVVALSDYKDSIRRKKADLLSRITLSDPSQLQSNPKFATMLEALGVDPPVKISPATGLQTFAFAKTDHAFMDLLEHEDVEVQALVSARLGIKTTIEETRSARFISIGLSTAAYMGGPYMPVPLKYSGAHTHRLSGDWKLNMQNLSARKTKAIRQALYAPLGHIIVAVDAAQIEARIVAWLAEQTDLLEMFRIGEDTYRAFAAMIFGIDSFTLVSKVQRFVGKTCILGLGFGMSALKLMRTIITLAREQNIVLGFDITIADCEHWVATYRQKFYAIQKCWWDINNLLMIMARGQADGYRIGPCVIEGTTIILPSGLKLFYDNLRMEQGDWYYDQAQFTKKIYGAKILENVTQALDRQHVTEAGIRTEIRALKAGLTDPRVLLNIHDENVHCVPEDEAVALADIALEEMRRNVPWSEGLPLNAEVKMGYNLGELYDYDPNSGE
jgi:DNA polymerase